MKNSVYILGSIEALVGVIILSIAAMIQDIMPLVGRVAYQAAAEGEYAASNYKVAFTLPVILSVLLIMAGAVQVIYAIVKKEK